MNTITTYSKLRVLAILWAEKCSLLRALELELLEQLELEFTFDWLDLGAGAKKSLEYKYIAHERARIQLCDLEAAEPNVKRVDLNKPLEFENDSYQGALLCHTLQYVYEVDMALSEVSRVTTKQCIIISPYALNYAPECGVDYARYRPQFLEKKLKQHGFPKARSYGFGLGPLTLAANCLDPFLNKLLIVRMGLFIAGALLDSALLSLFRPKIDAIRARCLIGCICIGEHNN